jgi:hypothetical protein
MDFEGDPETVGEEARRETHSWVEEDRGFRWVV